MASYIRYKGEFEYQELYSMLKDYFLSRDFDFYEWRYKDKGSEIKVNWKAEREYDEYNMVVFNIFLHVRSYTRVQVVREGKPRTLLKGRLQITFDYVIQQDYGPVKIFSGKGKLAEWVKKLHGAATQREFDEYWDVLGLSMQHDVMEQTKQLLGMQDSGN